MNEMCTLVHYFNLNFTVSLATVQFETANEQLTFVNKSNSIQVQFLYIVLLVNRFFLYQLKQNKKIQKKNVILKTKAVIVHVNISLHRNMSQSYYGLYFADSRKKPSEISFPKLL